MDYRANLKQLLMRGQMFKLKGQGIASIGSGISHMQIKDYRGTGTISHRAAVDRAINSMNNLNISGQGTFMDRKRDDNIIGRGARKKNYGISGHGKPKAKKTKGSGNFKSLKFNS